ncbi:MAG: transposase [Myxococcota bacterium]
MIDALRRFAPSFLQRRVSGATRSTLNLLLRCRTPALGGHRYQCDDCGYSAVLYNSCGNRHCPQCQGVRRRRWVETQQALLLPVPHFQVVFTLPSELRPIVLRYPREAYAVLLKASYGALQKLAATKWHATPAVLAVLHTWARDLSFHPHVHCVIAAGGMTDDDGWVTVSNDFLFHVRPLQRLFRGLFLGGLRALRLDLHRAERIRLRNARRKAALKNWNVYVEPPKGRDPALMVKYLARYVYQGAISDHRILAIDEDTVTIRTRGSEQVTLPGPEFVRRFSQHFLPTGFRRVRHYGLLAPGARRRLEQARAITLHLRRQREPEGVPPDEPPAATIIIGTHRNACPVCDSLLRVLIVPPDPTGWPRGPP